MKSLASWQFYLISGFRFDRRWKICLLGSYKCCYNVFCLVCVSVCVIWELKSLDAFTYRAVFILQVNESLLAYNCHKFSTKIGLLYWVFQFKTFFMCINAFSVVSYLLISNCNYLKDSERQNISTFVFVSSETQNTQNTE